MNKSLLYVGVGVVVVLLIAGAAMYMNKNESGVPGNGYPASGSPAAGSPAAQAPMSVKELLAQGGSQKCTYSHMVGGVDSSGIIYFSGGKMRGDFTSKVSGQTVESHMITDGQIAYMWSSQMAQGMKMNFAAMGAQGTQTTGIDMDQRLGYDCDSWSPDQGQFNPPSTITFMDLNAARP